MAHELEVAKRFTKVAQAASHGLDESGFRQTFAQCHSPIEQAFCLSLFQVQNVVAFDSQFSPKLLEKLLLIPTRIISVFPQHKILQFRADFLLVGTSQASAEPTFVIVECDGHDFHSEPKQIKYDQTRQNVLANTGFTVVRHTGSEIFSNPQQVIAKTLKPFANLGWKPDDAENVDNRILKQALNDLAVAAHTRTATR
jgi:very-short-patch-repair endonuclease